MSVEALYQILPESLDERKAILTYLARFAENTERYVDMCFYMRVRPFFSMIPQTILYSSIIFRI